MHDVYLDNNATTALDARVRVAMDPWLGHVGNAGSAHVPGRRAAEAISVAREQVAGLLRAAPRQIVFTSGATESNNLAIGGIAQRLERRDLVTSATEHPSVYWPMRLLAKSRQFALTVVPVDDEGLVDEWHVRRLQDEKTLGLVSVMAANNETGVLGRIEHVASAARACGAHMHTDATQLAPWGPIDVDELDVDLLTLSSHKMHGPQGVGALYIRRRTDIRGVAAGGQQEHGLRAGTLNTAGIVGFGMAAELAAVEGPEASKRITALRDELHTLLTATAGPVELNGHAEQRLPGTLNLAFPGADAEAIMAGAPRVAVATGSACSTGRPGPSHVLKAMGRSDELAACSLRFGLSRQTTDQEIALAARAIAASVATVRERAAVGTRPA